MTTSYSNPAAGDPATRERRYRYEANEVDAGYGRDGWSADAWRERSRIVVTPIAAPSILGLFGFMCATLLVGANMAGWWGTAASGMLIFPFAIMLGGVAQFLAGMWAYKARDGVGTAMHGIWGGFWLAFGLYQLFVSVGKLPAVTFPMDVSFGWWFIPICVITMMGAFASLATSLGLFGVLSTLAAGSGFAAAGFIGGLHWAIVVAGWLFVISAAIAWYFASAMMLRGAFGRTVLPTGEWSVAANLPGRAPAAPVEYAEGMPGAKAGQ